MNGLSQTQIFDRVKAECKEFYQDETCCKADRSVYPYGIQHNHGLDYGACLEPEERRAKQQET